MYKPGRKLQVSAKKSQTKLAKIHFTELKSEKIPKLLKNRKWNPSKFIVTRFFLMLTPKKLNFSASLNIFEVVFA